MALTRNLGQVSAIFIGTSAPVNTTLLWYDTSLPSPIHKYYDTSISQWVTLVPFAVPDNYRLNDFSISTQTNVVFSSSLSSSNYFVEVLEYKASPSNVIVSSGWVINNKTNSGFTFTPPSRYEVGTLYYKATLLK